MTISQKEFLNILAAPQDVSLPILQDLLDQGYTEVRWNTSPSAVDEPCIVKNGDQFGLQDFISGLAHAAPIFEKTHVGCHCTVTVTGPDLPDVTVSAFGINTGLIPPSLSPSPGKGNKGVKPGPGAGPDKPAEKPVTKLPAIPVPPKFTPKQATSFTAPKEEEIPAPARNWFQRFFDRFKKKKE